MYGTVETQMTHAQLFGLFSGSREHTSDSKLHGKKDY